MQMQAYRKSYCYKWKPLDRWPLFDESLRNFYGKKNNHKIHNSPKIGDLCLILRDEGPLRCRIMNKSHANVEIRLIDTGETQTCNSSDLMVLKTEFKSFPSQAIDIYIVGIQPADAESNWLKIAAKNVDHWFSGAKLDDNLNCYIESTICLHLNDAIFVDDIRLVKKLPSSYNEIVSIKKELIKHKFAVCDEIGICNFKGKFLELKSKNTDVSSTDSEQNEDNLLDMSVPDFMNDADRSTNTDLSTMKNILDSSIPESVKNLLPSVLKNIFSPTPVVEKDAYSTPVVQKDDKLCETNELHETENCSTEALQTYTAPDESSGINENLAKVESENGTACIDYDPTTESTDAANEDDEEIVKEVQELVTKHNYKNSQWGSLENDCLEQVNISAFYTPENFYVRNLSKYKDR